MKQTPSFKDFGDFYEVSGDFRGDTRDGKLEKGDVAGVIVHVSHWGKIGKACTVYLNRRGIDYKYEYRPIEKKSGTIDKYADAHITEYNIYTEEGCAYAEEVAMHALEVEMEYSRKILPTWYFYRNIIHSIKVIDTTSPFLKQ